MRGLSFGELLDYSAEESNHWRDFFTQHPDALDVPCDIAGTKTVRELVLHIVAVQMRYAERLLNMPITEYDTAGRPDCRKESPVKSCSRFPARAWKTCAASPSPPMMLTGTARSRFPRARPVSSPPAGARSLFMRCCTASGTGPSSRRICARRATSRTGCMILLRPG